MRRMELSELQRDDDGHYNQQEKVMGRTTAAQIDPTLYKEQMGL